MNIKNLVRAVSKIKNKNESVYTLEDIDKPLSFTGRKVIYLFVIVCVLIIIWSILGKIDEVSIATGKMIPTGYSKVVQTEVEGKIKKIDVENGQKVHVGDVLIELDSTVSDADYAQLKRKEAYLQIEIARSIAEQTGNAFHPEQITGASKEDIAFERDLYQKRVAEQHSKLATEQAAIEKVTSSTAVSRDTKEKVAEELALATDRESRMANMVSKGIVSTFVYSDYLEKKTDLEKDMNTQTDAILGNEHSLEEEHQKLNTIIADYDQDVTTKLVDAKRQLELVEEELKKADRKLAINKIVAPIDGIVQQIVMHTVGGIVTPAEALMIIVPEGSKMQAEVLVQNADIGFVHEGQDAEIKVDTFNFQKYGTIKAKVLNISADSMDDKSQGLIYRAVLELDKDYFDKDGEKLFITPGMSLTAEIKTRRKRIIEYFLEPFMTYKSEAFRERS